MARIRKVLFFSAVTLFVIFGAFLLFGQFALKQYVSSLRASGEKVRLEELYDSLSKNVPDTTGALTNVVARLGPAPVKAPAILQLSSPGTATIAWQQAELVVENGPTAGGKSAQSGTNYSWKRLRTELDKKSADLAELRKILQNPAANEGSR